MMPKDEMGAAEMLKQAAARRALAEVRSGMRLGLGTGSTTSIFVRLLGEALAMGQLHDVCGVATSEATASLAQSLGIPLLPLDDVAFLDLAVDGADEVDPDLNLIKGRGRALLREKLVEIQSARFLVIVDASKLVARLGTTGALPVEITPFGARATVRWLQGLCDHAELWLDERGGSREPLVTDNGNVLARCWFDRGIGDAYALARQLADRPGVVEHGLFLDLASAVIVAGAMNAGEGEVRILERGTGRLGDRETGKPGNQETGRAGDWETGRLGNRETGRPGSGIQNSEHSTRNTDYE